jgi:hypothetical protein
MSSDHALVRPKSKQEEPDHELTLEKFLYHSTPTAIRLRYREQLNKSDALQELAKLRTICQWAAEEINQRLVPDEEECMICGTKMAPGQKPAMMTIVKDPDTGTIQSRVLCKLECIREYNRTKMGLAELIK